MKKWNKENVAFIMAQTDYARRGIEEKGVRVFSPYYGDNLPLRVFREICFRLPFLPKEIWYKKQILRRVYTHIVIIDVNITEHYLNWIKRKYPKAQVNFLYDNMVGKARNIEPSRIPNGIRIWTYDDFDAQKYGINLYYNYWIRDMIFQLKQNAEFDVSFVGKDKGRGKGLLHLEKELQKMGLKTKFVITKNGRLSLPKSYYQAPIPYEQVIELDTRSRAILNITMDNQKGVTMRDMESVAIGVKLITTNKNIVNKDLYNKRNVFILGVDDFEKLPEFLKSEYVDVLDSIKDKHTFEAMLDEITSEKIGMR